MLLTSPAPALQAAHLTVVAGAVGRAGAAAVAGQRHFHGTDNVFVMTDARQGLARRPAIFLAGRKRVLGTVPLSLSMMVRAASGWLSARPSKFSPHARTAPAEGPERRRRHFPAGRKRVLGTVPLSLLMMVRAASGWLSARPSFLSTPGGAVGDGYHVPVFPTEVAEWMAAGSGSFIIDGTLGGGGHSEILLKTGARVLGVDRDPEALAHARARLAPYGDRFSTWEGNFSRLREHPGIQKGELADGLLLDLGVSSRQLDSAERGFSFQKQGPLDMRMGPSSPHTAAEVVNTWPEAELTKIFFEFGEEPKARRIAAAIVRRRAEKPFETTLDLAGHIEKTVGRHGRTHPATRSFQAIRMAVNEELDSLAAALAAAPALLKPGGRLLIITFHSLEDRMVKRFLRHRSTPELDDPAWPGPRPNPDFQFRLLSRKAIAPTAEEIANNPRARSAKLRVAQLLDPTP